MNISIKSSGLAVFVAMALSMSAQAGPPSDGPYNSICSMSFTEFKDAAITAAFNTKDVGFGLPMWATLMDHTGKVCHVVAVNTLNEIGGSDVSKAAWLGSRVISAQKANTANAFSINGLSIPTGAISATVYPGGSLYGLQHSNPVDTEAAYEGDATRFGTEQDPLEGERVGGVNVFGGGIALYEAGIKVGAVGVSGDTSCRDASMAFNLRATLGYDDGVVGGNLDGDDTLYLVDFPDELYEQPLCGVNDPNNETDFGVVTGDAPSL